MSIKQYVVGKLQEVLGDYVEGLTAENLEMQLFSGVIKQRNLRLKKAALSKLKLPINVEAGYLGLLSVTVPWRNLSTERVVITIEDVSLVAVPNQDNAGGSFAEDAEERLAMLAAELEQRIRWVAERELLRGKDDEPEGPGMAERLGDRVMQNLVVTITNVHLRFEDIPTVGGEGEGEAAVRGVGGVPLLRPVAVGFVLRELCIAATDDGGAPVFFADHSDQHKELRLCGLDIYSENPPPDAQLSVKLGGIDPTDDTAVASFFAQELHAGRFTERAVPSQRRYIFTHGEDLRLRMHIPDGRVKAPLERFDLIGCTLPELQLRWDRVQTEDFSRLGKSLQALRMPPVVLPQCLGYYPDARRTAKRRSQDEAEALREEWRDTFGLVAACSSGVELGFGEGVAAAAAARLSERDVATALRALDFHPSGDELAQMLANSSSGGGGVSGTGLPEFLRVAAKCDAMTTKWRGCEESFATHDITPSARWGLLPKDGFLTGGEIRGWVGDLDLLEPALTEEEVGVIVREGESSTGDGQVDLEWCQYGLRLIRDRRVYERLCYANYSVITCGLGSDATWADLGDERELRMLEARMDLNHVMACRAFAERKRHAEAERSRSSSLEASSWGSWSSWIGYSEAESSALGYEFQMTEEDEQELRRAVMIDTKTTSPIAGAVDDKLATAIAFETSPAADPAKSVAFNLQVGLVVTVSNGADLMRMEVGGAVTASYFLHDGRIMAELDSDFPIIDDCRIRSMALHRNGTGRIIEGGAVAPSPTPAAAAAVRSFKLLVENPGRPKRFLRVEAATMSDLTSKVEEGLPYSVPLCMTPAATSVCAAVPFSDLADVPEKARISVWPKSLFTDTVGEGRILGPMLPSEGVGDGQGGQFIVVKFEARPQEKRQMISLTMATPLVYVHAADLLEDVSEVFTLPAVEREWDYNEEVALDMEAVQIAMDGFSVRQSSQLRRQLTERKTTTVTMDVAAPVIVVPVDRIARDSVCLVVSLGTLHFTGGQLDATGLDERSGSRSFRPCEETFASDQRDLKEFRPDVPITGSAELSLRDTQVLLLPHGIDSLARTLAGEDNADRLLQRVSFELTANVGVVPMRRVVVDCSLGPVALTVCRRQARQLVRLKNALEALESDAAKAEAANAVEAEAEAARSELTSLGGGAPPAVDIMPILQGAPDVSYFVQFECRHIGLSILADLDAASPLAQVDIARVQVGLAISRDCTRCAFILQGINARAAHSDAHGGLVPLLETPASAGEDLVRIYFEEDLQRRDVVAKMEDLVLTWHTECVVTVRRGFFEGIEEDYEDLPVSTDEAARKALMKAGRGKLREAVLRQTPARKFQEAVGLAAAAAATAAAERPLMEIPAAASVQTKRTIHALLSLRGLTIVLAEAAAPLYTTKLTDAAVKANIDVQGGKTVELTLTNLQCFHNASASFFPQLVGADGPAARRDALVTVSYEQVAPSLTESKGFDSMLELKLAPLKICAVRSCIEELQAYVGTSMDAVKQQAIDSATQAVNVAVETSSTRDIVKIQVDKPTLVYADSPRSYCWIELTPKRTTALVDGSKFSVAVHDQVSCNIVGDFKGVSSELFHLELALHQCRVKVDSDDDTKTVDCAFDIMGEFWDVRRSGWSEFLALKEMELSVSSKLAPQAGWDVQFAPIAARQSGGGSKSTLIVSGALISAATHYANAVDWVRRGTGTDDEDTSIVKPLSSRVVNQTGVKLHFSVTHEGEDIAADGAAKFMIAVDPGGDMPYETQYSRLNQVSPASMDICLDGWESCYIPLGVVDDFEREITRTTDRDSFGTPWHERAFLLFEVRLDDGAMVITASSTLIVRNCCGTDIEFMAMHRTDESEPVTVRGLEWSMLSTKGDGNPVIDYLPVACGHCEDLRLRLPGLEWSSKPVVVPVVDGSSAKVFVRRHQTIECSKGDETWHFNCEVVTTNRIRRVTVSSPFRFENLLPCPFHGIIKVQDVEQELHIPPGKTLASHRYQSVTPQDSVGIVELELDGWAKAINLKVKFGGESETILLKAEGSGHKLPLKLQMLVGNDQTVTLRISAEMLLINRASLGLQVLSDKAWSGVWPAPEVSSITMLPLVTGSAVGPRSGASGNLEIRMSAKGCPLFSCMLKQGSDFTNFAQHNISNSPSFHCLSFQSSEGPESFYDTKVITVFARWSVMNGLSDPIRFRACSNDGFRRFDPQVIQQADPMWQNDRVLQVHTLTEGQDASMSASFPHDPSAMDTQMRGQVTVEGWNWPDGFSFSMDDTGMCTLQLTHEEDDETRLVQVQVRRSTTQSEFAIDIMPAETGTEAPVTMREPEAAADLVRESQLLEAGLTRLQVQARLARQHPVWISEEKKACMLCSSPFTIRLRRHHCRVCGWMVCSKCAPERYTVMTDRWCSSTEGHALTQLTDGSKKEKRCCRSCFDNAPREIEVRLATRLAELEALDRRGEGLSFRSSSNQSDGFVSIDRAASGDGKDVAVAQNDVTISFPDLDIVLNAFDHVDNIHCSRLSEAEIHELQGDAIVTATMKNLEVQVKQLAGEAVALRLSVGWVAIVSTSELDGRITESRIESQAFVGRTKPFVEVTGTLTFVDATTFSSGVSRTTIDNVRVTMGCGLKVSVTDVFLLKLRELEANFARFRTGALEQPFKPWEQVEYWEDSVGLRRSLAAHTRRTASALPESSAPEKETDEDRPPPTDLLFRNVNVDVLSVLLDFTRASEREPEFFSMPISKLTIPRGFSAVVEVPAATLAFHGTGFPQEVFEGLGKQYFEQNWPEVLSKVGALVVQSYGQLGGERVAARSKQMLNLNTAGSLRKRNYEPKEMSNREIQDEHFRKFGAASSEEQLLEQAFHCAFDWSENHQGASARTAIIMLIINRSSRPVTIEKVETRDWKAGIGTAAEVSNRELLPNHEGGAEFDPSQCCAVLVQGTKLDVTCALKTTSFELVANVAKGVDERKLLARPGFHCTVEFEENSTWWAVQQVSVMDDNSNAVLSEGQVAECYENQRMAVFEIQKSWSTSSLLLTDRGAWSDLEGTIEFSGADDPALLPRGMVWAPGSEWSLAEGEADGWRYASNWAGTLRGWTDSERLTDHVRRRAWRRTYVLPEMVLGRAAV